MRECLQDVFDVPSLRELQRELSTGHVRVVEVETPRASPFAQSLLFSYVSAFLYEGDAPLAERRAAALTVDTQLLRELLGQAELRELLDPDAIAAVERRVGWLTDERRLRDVESVADALRVLGPLTDRDLSERGADLDWAVALKDAGRAVRLRVAGEQRWVAVEDLARLRDALGLPIPPGVPGAYAESVPDPVADLVSRYARTHGPFTTTNAATALGLGPAVVDGTLQRLVTRGTVVAGAFRPGGSGPEWCDSEVLRQIRRASLALAQQAAEPVPAERLATFLAGWQHVGHNGPAAPLTGVDGVYRVIDQLAGAVAPASEWELGLLPSRVDRYRPEWLDELTASGEVTWFGAGALAGGDGWLGLVPSDRLDELLPAPVDSVELTDVHAELLALFTPGVALLTRGVEEALDHLPRDVVGPGLWDLAWAGYLSNDSLAVVRQHLGHSRRPVTPRITTRRRARPAPSVPGRWYRLPTPDSSATARAHATAQTLLDRHGVLTRGVAQSERIPGGFAALYRMLAAMEEAGRARRGYFVEGLGAAQFSVGTAIDQLRALPQPQSVALAATDPANPFGAALAWPRSADTHLPGRKAGATVVVDEDGLALFVERGGRSLLTWCIPESERASRAVTALVASVRGGHRPPLHVQRVDGQPVHDSPWVGVLSEGGLTVTPRGLRLRPDRRQAAG
jgi:ATP-dependent Lhr-like helicase